MIGWWRSHGVRIKLTLWYIAAMIVVLGIYVSAVYSFVGTRASEALDQQLRRDFHWASATVDIRPDGSGTWTEPQLLLGENDLPWIQAWDNMRRVLIVRSGEAQRQPVDGSQSLAGLANDRGIIRSVPVDGQAPMRVLSRRTRIRNQSITIQVARSEAAMRQELRELLLILLFGLPLAVVAAGLGSYTLARRALVPIERMTERAQHITAERLGERLPVENPRDEMGRLALVFNETLGRLEESFDQMRRFTADVSHELRTPLTAIRSVGEVGLRGHRDEQAYRTIIGSMLEEADRLASLVDRLLTLSRAETGQANLTLEPIDLAELADNVVAHLGVLAEEKRQSLVVQRTGRAEALADRTVLRQALINLVDNAIKFTPAGGAVRVGIEETPLTAIIDVVDSGSGIPEEAQARIFDRFYRAKASARGTGLGLSIAKGAVDAVGGRLTLLRSGVDGTTFRITLPRPPAPARARGAAPRSDTPSAPARALDA